MPDNDVFHVGEIAVQVRAGERATAERRASMIGDRLGDSMRAFLQLGDTAAVGAVGEDGALWASLWCGAPGFLRADATGEHISLVAALDRPVAADPVRQAVREGASLGMLVIDFMTRRRLRINGIIRRVDGAGFELGVRETFGNCIKYIQRRQRALGLPAERMDAAVASVAGGHTLDDERRSFIARTDTAFIASLHPERGVDVSHRGGQPGFLRIAGERELRIPDYPGNSMFQTLGNVEIDARAGLALIDFERARVLSLSGLAVTAFGTEDPQHPTGGTGRYWSFTVDQWLEIPLPSMMTWMLLDRSSFNP
jgi:predicted pyridoxine 5'-phosphate oxidase superfamily flavin-nucleotide-binding protein